MSLTAFSRTEEWVARASRLSARNKLIGWLLVFFCAYRIGLPLLYAAALAALPLLLLPDPRSES